MMKSYVVCAVLLLLGGTVWAENEVILHLNGKFLGGAPGAFTAPGWSADNAAGKCRVIPVSKDEARQEMVTSGNSKTIFSDFLPVSGSVLKIKLEYSGSGMAAVSCFCYDRDRRPLGEMKSYHLTLTDRRMKFKNSFPLSPGSAYVRIGLTAGNHTCADFCKVEAKLPVNVPEHQSMAVPRLQVSVPPAASAAVVPAPQPAAAPESVSSAIPDRAVMLQHDQKIFFRDIPDQAIYQAITSVGRDFDFELGEDSSQNLFWQITAYDSGKCRVKIEHDRSGIGSLNLDDAEIEIKPYFRGTFRFDFKCGAKRAVLYLRVL